VRVSDEGFRALAREAASGRGYSFGVTGIVAALCACVSIGFGWLGYRQTQAKRRELGRPALPRALGIVIVLALACGVLSLLLQVADRLN
jgi:hypothetical protein